ncbi:hypothetical protein [Planotetraspora phitsanulokensis]|uniref:Uncharacterized protein n=1 Tax=Planotetraspora phitsanulokensis TaxID=575192 RepID=A0A8J3UBM5_9ACTN|nr:hypothetical protein [Planotetraspora phitsanulokensis]GII42459.1 hypothetical protein Pph01_74620 [Planotetraspora phitsanulokensis]
MSVFLRATSALALLLLSGSALAAAPAQARSCAYSSCGEVRNALPRTFTVKAAVFGEGSERCVTYNAGGFPCRTYWLPSGKGSKDVGVEDADAFMVTSTYQVGRFAGTTVPGFTWTRITSPLTAFCGLPGDATTPTCYW